jgi:NAD(P)-dependent dehydrogenase (short-subunit alcohol dehydrogenase family)
VGWEDWQAAWQRTLDANLLGPAHVTYWAARHMIANGVGRIIAISSRGAVRGEPEAPAYAAAKAGLNAMSQSLARALAPHGVQLYVVSPGWVETDMSAAHLAGPEGDAIREQSPLGRVARPAEVASTVAFLACDDTEYLTGSIVDLFGASYLRS